MPWPGDRPQTTSASRLLQLPPKQPADFSPAAFAKIPAEQYACVFDHQYEPQTQGDLTTRAKTEFLRPGLLKAWTGSELSRPINPIPSSQQGLRAFRKSYAEMERPHSATFIEGESHVY